ncbi:hypothetical protein [Mycetocola saprophilus]|uniref:hypothetical protein n=1 Tax=Mycetocola saprophilus TaxID=76636 RepID=UPI003BF1E00F
MKRKIVLIGALVTALIVGTSSAALAAPQTDKSALIDRALEVVGEPTLASEVAISGISIQNDVGVLQTARGAIRVAPKNKNGSEFRLRSDGLQVLSVLNEGETSATFGISLPFGSTLRQQGRQIEAVTEVDGAVIAFATFEAPWAVDARGALVPTTYSIESGNVVQRIESKNATYPVVVDPKVSAQVVGPGGPGVFLSLKGIEIIGFGGLAYSILAVGPAAACTLAKIPQALAAIVRLLCTFVAPATVYDVFARLQEGTKNVAPNACYRARIFPNADNYSKVASSFC